MIQLILNSVLPLFHLYGYRILFISSFLESLPIIGTVVPGATIAVFAGYVVRKHVLHFTIAFIFLGVGAFLGDVLNYFLGRYFGYSFIKKYGKYIFLTEARLQMVRDRIKNNSGKTLILGRFTSFTRSIAPFAAGASDVKVLPFISYTLVSAFSWAFSHLLIGFIFGKWLEKISRYLGLIFFLSILVGFGLVYLYRFIDRRHHIFKRFHVYTLITMIFSLFVFTELLEKVLENGKIIKLNDYIAHAVMTIRNPLLTEFMIFVTNGASGVYFVVLTFILVFYLFQSKRSYLAYLTMFSLALGETSQYVLKAMIGIPRPENQLVHTLLSSFPSGHTTAATIFGSFFFLTFVEQIKSTWGKYVLFFATLFGVLLVGFSRIYLNVHWTTDVVAGISLGLFTMSFSVLLFRVVVFAKRWLY